MKVIVLGYVVASAGLTSAQSIALCGRLRVEASGAPGCSQDAQLLATLYGQLTLQGGTKCTA